MENKAQKEADRKKQLLIWIIGHWDCFDLEHAMELAKENKELHMKLREAGIQFE